MQSVIARTTDGFDAQAGFIDPPGFSAAKKRPETGRVK